MRQSDGILILGASGLAGRYLFNSMRDRKKIIGTYCNNEQENLVHFDISKDSLDKLDLENIRYGVICSAIAKVDKCKDDLEYSNKVNVVGITRMITELTERNILPIFFSSAAVFDGELGGYKENDERNPLGIYGRQKLEIEDFLIDNFPDFLLIRPGKIFGLNLGEGGLFADWIHKYRKNERIMCAYDERISPIYAGDLARAVETLIDMDKRGIYNINPFGGYNRVELARKFFAYLGINDAKIISCSTKDLGFSEKRAKNTWMNSNKFTGETGFKFTSLEDCFKLIKEANK